MKLKLDSFKIQVFQNFGFIPFELPENESFQTIFINRLLIV